VFSFQDEDEQWLSLRYDLTAPLARYVAADYDALPKPFRRYQSGYVYRNEKPGPGRFRQFMQFDADTVGTANPAADAELCMLAADTLEALGLKGNYVVKISNRKLLDGVLASIDLGGEINAARRLIVLRAIDKLDKLQWEGVEQLLGGGRKDESGDFTKGANLDSDQIHEIKTLVLSQPSADDVESIADWERNDSIYVGGNMSSDAFNYAFFDEPGLHRVPITNIATIKKLRGHFSGSDLITEALDELEQIAEHVRASEYGTKRIRIDPSVVRGLEYYTGPVFEAELTFPARDEAGQPVRFGSVGGGGRYDGLVSRFRGAPVPATGFSIGVSRLYAALSHLGKIYGGAIAGPVVVLVMDKERVGDFQRMTNELRHAGVRAEMYLGEAGMKAQMKYADKRGAPCVIIQGEDEHARGEVTIKDLHEGARLSGEIADHAEWREGRPAQFSVSQDEMIAEVQRLLAAQKRS